ncbi:MAG: hypothetical protein V4480_02540 [Patescibacteria group bacterium]
MLYVLGGSSRSGKTLLARRAVVEKQIPYFPLDGLFYSLVHGAPEFGVLYENTLKERPHKMWPLVKPLLNYFLKEEKEYLIEGDSILPSQVSESIAEGKPIKCCFVGYAESNKDEKLALVREYHQGDADWTKDISDEEMLPMIDEMIEFSQYLKEECSKYDIKYFDVSHDFEGVYTEAFEYLFSK